MKKTKDRPNAVTGERRIEGAKARHNPLVALFDTIRKDNPACYHELVRLFEADLKRVPRK